MVIVLQFLGWDQKHSNDLVSLASKRHLDLSEYLCIVFGAFLLDYIAPDRHKHQDSLSPVCRA